MVLALEAERLIEATRGSLENCESEAELFKLRGQIQGIRAMAAAISAQGEV